MIVNFDTQLVNLKGEALKENDTPVTLKDICANALLANDEKMEGRIKLENWNLAQLVYKGGEIELTAEQVVKMKDMVAKHFPTLVAGQVLNILDK